MHNEFPRGSTDAPEFEGHRERLRVTAPSENKCEMKRAATLNFSAKTLISIILSVFDPFSPH